MVLQVVHVEVDQLLLHQEQLQVYDLRARSVRSPNPNPRVRANPNPNPSLNPNPSRVVITIIVVALHHHRHFAEERVELVLDYLHVGVAVCDAALCLRQTFLERLEGVGGG